MNQRTRMMNFLSHLPISPLPRKMMMLSLLPLPIYPKPKLKHQQKVEVEEELLPRHHLLEEMLS
jgi:hypothetical protein